MHFTVRQLLRLQRRSPSSAAVRHPPHSAFSSVLRTPGQVGRWPSRQAAEARTSSAPGRSARNRSAGKIWSCRDSDGNDQGIVGRRLAGRPESAPPEQLAEPFVVRDKLRATRVLRTRQRTGKRARHDGRWQPFCARRSKHAAYGLKTTENENPTETQCTVRARMAAGDRARCTNKRPRSSTDPNNDKQTF